MEAAGAVNGLQTGHLQGVQRVGKGLQVPARKVQINRRVFESDMAQQELDRAQVGSRFQQMRGVGMSQVMF